jgi:hypothetical protein
MKTSIVFMSWTIMLSGSNAVSYYSYVREEAQHSQKSTPVDRHHIRISAGRALPATAAQRPAWYS